MQEILSITHCPQSPYACSVALMLLQLDELSKPHAVKESSLKRYNNRRFANSPNLQLLPPFPKVCSEFTLTPVTGDKRMDLHCKENAKSSYKSDSFSYISGCYAELEAVSCMQYTGSNLYFQKLKWHDNISHTALRSPAPQIFST